MGQRRPGHPRYSRRGEARHHPQQYTLPNLDKHECYGCGSNTYGQIAVEQGQTTKPMPIASLKDMKITGVFCGSYHSFVQTVKGELYGFGLNMKGQLGIGTFDN
jgi:alpha-tubulin suppressor-like RCC1 family protein